MIVNWLDYAWGRPSPTSMGRGGIVGVSRYLWDGGKGVTSSEISALHNAGVGVLANYEADAGMVFEGTAAAVEHGKRAVGYAEALGVPHGKPIVYSADRDLVTSSDFRAVAGFFETVGKNSGPYGVGAYGEADVIDYLFQHGLITFGWQTVAWSNRRISVRAALYQFSINNYWGGQSVDFNTVLDLPAVTAAAWMPPGKEQGSSGTPVKITSPVEDDMSYEILQDTHTGALVAAGPGMWAHLEGKTKAATQDNLQKMRTSPLCANRGIVRKISPEGMALYKRAFVGGVK